MILDFNTFQLTGAKWWNYWNWLVGSLPARLIILFDVLGYVRGIKSWTHILRFNLNLKLTLFATRLHCFFKGKVKLKWSGEYGSSSEFSSPESQETKRPKDQKYYMKSCINGSYDLHVWSLYSLFAADVSTCTFIRSGSHIAFTFECTIYDKGLKHNDFNSKYMLFFKIRPWRNRTVRLYWLSSAWKWTWCSICPGFFYHASHMHSTSIGASFSDMSRL